jgi:TetR/AcrR family transcriptional repressor of nem operon
MKKNLAAKDNLKTAQKIQSKERILNVASRLFKKHGFAATGIDQIMDEAGLTAGAFYAHFKSKQDLFEQSLDHSMRYSRHLLLKDTENLSGEEKINIIMKKYVSFLHRDLVEKGCALPAMASELYRASKKNNHLVANYLAAWTQIITDNLPSEMSLSARRKKALAMISKAVGTILLSRLSGGTEISNELIDSFET